MICTFVDLFDSTYMIINNNIRWSCLYHLLLFEAFERISATSSFRKTLKKTWFLTENLSPGVMILLLSWRLGPQKPDDSQMVCSDSARDKSQVLV